MDTRTARRGLHRGTVLLVVSVVGALLLGTTGGAVGASLITSAQIKNGTIRGVDIRNNTITGAKIKKGTISSSDIKDRTIVAKDVKKSSLTGELVKNRSLRGADVAKETLTGAHILDGSLTLADLAPELQTHWAVVNSDGTLARGTQGATSSRPGTGIFRVTFPVDVNECAFSATLGNAVDGTPGSGVVTATPWSGDTKSIFVTTHSLADVGANRAFHIAVHC